MRELAREAARASEFARAELTYELKLAYASRLARESAWESRLSRESARGATYAGIGARLSVGPGVTACATYAGADTKMLGNMRGEAPPRIRLYKRGMPRSESVC